MRLQTQVQGIPYKSQEAEEQRFTEDRHESNQAVQNETLLVRGRREVIYNFTAFCGAANYAISDGPSSDVCVKRWYYCRGYAEPVCKERSWGCYSVGAKCKTEFVFWLIENKKVKRTTCRCAV